MIYLSIQVRITYLNVIDVDLAENPSIRASKVSKMCENEPKSQTGTIYTKKKNCTPVGDGRASPCNAPRLGVMASTSCLASHLAWV